MKRFDVTVSLYDHDRLVAIFKNTIEADSAEAAEEMAENRLELYEESGVNYVEYQTIEL